METYIRVRSNKGDTLTVSARSLATLLGLDGDVQQIELCRDIPAGELSACIPCPGENDPYPGIDVVLQMEGHDIPVLLSRSEQPFGEQPKTYLYGCGDSYIAYSPADTREDEERDDLKNSVLVVGGDSDDQLQVYLENHYVKVHGSDFQADFLRKVCGENPEGHVVIVTASEDEGRLRELRFDSLQDALFGLRSGIAGASKIMAVLVGDDYIINVDGIRSSAVSVKDAIKKLEEVIT